LACSSPPIFEFLKVEFIKRKQTENFEENLEKVLDVTGPTGVVLDDGWMFLLTPKDTRRYSEKFFNTLINKFPEILI